MEKEYKDIKNVLKLQKKYLKKEKLTPHELHMLALGLIEWGNNIWEYWWWIDGGKLLDENN